MRTSASPNEERGSAAEGVVELLQHAEQAMQEALHQLDERSLTPMNQPATPPASSARRWFRQLARGDACVRLRDVYRRSAHAVSTLQLRDLLSDGEAVSVRESLDRLLAASLNIVEERSREVEQRSPEQRPQRTFTRVPDNDWPSG